VFVKFILILILIAAMALQEIQIAGKLQLGFLCPRKRRAAPSCKHHHHHDHCMPNSSYYYPSSSSSLSSSSRRKRERLHKSDRREELLGLEFAAAEDCRGFAVIATNHRARVSAIVRSAGVLSSRQFRSSSIGNNNRGFSSSSLHQSSSLRRRFAGLGSEVQAVEALDLQQVGGGGGDEVLKLGEFLWTAALSGIHSFLGLYILAAAFVFAGGGAVAALAARASRHEREEEEEEEEEVKQQLLLGFEDSLLISQPTPFNRFVYGRCPSMFSPGAAAAAAVADVQAPLHMGKKRRKKKKQTKDQEKINRVEYQRTCLVAHDSGVVSLDWPMQLEFAADNGFDNTLLLIPGTTEGSGDQGIQRFVMRAACCGYFPIVLNPRGCAASPLTTPRH
jgi:ribosomal protein L12E/L44/L45/RPP1/RPP2